MKPRLLFIHSILNTPYKHVFYNLLTKDFEVHVIQLAYKSKIRNWEEPGEKLYSEYVISKGFIEVRNKLDSLIKIYKLIEVIQPSVIIVHGYQRFEYLLIPYIFKNKINICEVATTFPDRKRNFVKEKIKYFIIDNLFNFFLTYGNASKNYLTNNLGINSQKVFIKGNFSHLQLYPAASNNWAERENQVLFVGRLSKEKNIINLILAFIQFKKNTDNNFKLIIIGIGSEKTELLNIIDKMDAKGFIAILDEMSPKALVKFYLNSKLFVLPSLSEPWGQVINEAMHFGLPILISKSCGSAIDLCDSENSVVFNIDMENELLEKLTLILNDDNKLSQMSISNLQKIKSYNPNLQTLKTADFLKNAIASKLLD